MSYLKRGEREEPSESVSEDVIVKSDPAIKSVRSGSQSQMGLCPA